MIDTDRLRRRLRRRRVGTCGLMILVASLAGCIEPPASPAPPPTPQALPSAGPAPSEGATPPALVATSEPATVAAVMPPTPPAEAAAPARPAAPPRPPAPGDPRRLIGLTQERIQAILGPADFVRRDGPAQIWRYDAEDCSLDVFLFREGEMQRVTHVASRARKADAPDIPLNACYARVLGARRGGPAS